MRSFIALALLVAPLSASSASSSAVARAWLQSHKSPTDDQLAELKNANPDAFAMVSALLAKHAKGQDQQLSADEKGPDVFRRMMTPRHLSMSTRAATPYAAAEPTYAQPIVQDNMQYDANAASNKDEHMVDGLLNAVAQLGGDKAKKIALLRQRRHKNVEPVNPLLADQSMFEEPKPVRPVMAAAAVEEQVASVVAPEEQPAPRRKENSYLKGLDLSGDMPVVHEQKQARRPRNAYMKDIDLNAMSQENTLTSFSFDDGESKPKPKPAVAPKPKKENVFAKWLGLTATKPAQESAVQVQPAQPVQKKDHSYLDIFK